MKMTWLYTCVGRGRGKFTITKKCGADGKYMNTLVVTTVPKALFVLKSKSKNKYNYKYHIESVHFNFKN